MRKQGKHSETVYNYILENELYKRGMSRLIISESELLNRMSLRKAPAHVSCAESAVKLAERHGRMKSTRLTPLFCMISQEI